MHKELIGDTEFIFRRVEEEDFLNHLFRLRFQVYCKECNFIKEEDYPEGIEKDKYDPHSLHFVAQNQQGPIGTARLVMHSPLGFPIEEHCADILVPKKLALPRQNLAEISRLVISKDYRRRREDGMYYSVHCECGHEASAQDLIRRIRPMTFGIYREMYQESKRRNITHWCALMERPLYLLLRMHGFVFQCIGEEIDFYGPVRPYLGSIEEMERAVFHKIPKMIDYFLDGLEPQYHPKFQE